ncbi:MAG: MarR family transcriptional regulator [Bacteroidetes bacterium]|nr:MAG: MarR family transcriptional regulator [Bacteroidota bacterium]
MHNNTVIEVRKISQLYAYTSLQLHEAVSKKAGFTGTDHKYLGFFLQKESLTAGELAALTGLTTGAVTGLIDRFEKKKLVKRSFDKSDRRKVIVVANKDKITDLLAPFYTAFQLETEKLIASYTESELAVIESFLERSIELMNQTKETITKPLNNE